MFQTLIKYFISNIRSVVAPFSGYAYRQCIYLQTRNVHLRRGILIYTCIFCMFRIHVSDNENLEKVFPTGINRISMLEDGVGGVGGIFTTGIVDQKIDKCSTYLIFCIHILLGLMLGSGQAQENGLCWGWDSQALRISLRFRSLSWLMIVTNMRSVQ